MRRIVLRGVGVAIGMMAVGVHAHQRAVIDHPLEIALLIHRSTIVAIPIAVLAHDAAHRRQPAADDNRARIDALDLRIGAAEHLRVERRIGRATVPEAPDVRLVADLVGLDAPAPGARDLRDVLVPGGHIV